MHNETPFSIFNSPFQFLGRLVRSFFNISRQQEAISTRSALKECGEIDVHTLTNSLHKRQDNEKRILLHHLSLAGWSSELLGKLDRLTEVDVCSCGISNPGLQHVLLECKDFDDARVGSDPVIGKLLASSKPVHTKLGFPLTLPADSLCFSATQTHKHTHKHKYTRAHKGMHKRAHKAKQKSAMGSPCGGGCFKTTEDPAK